MVRPSWLALKERVVHQRQRDSREIPDVNPVAILGNPCFQLSLLHPSGVSHVVILMRQRDSELACQRAQTKLRDFQEARSRSSREILISALSYLTIVVLGA
jgi:hypothetical protein